MTTEYYQIPSQQGFLPLVEETADPWLAAATASLSINDWNINKEKQATNSLFEPDDVDAVSWRNVVPKQYNKPEVKAPVAPKQFNSTQLKIDAWGVVDEDENTPTTNNKQKKAKQQNKAQPAKQTKQPKEEPKIEDELSIQNRYKTELCKSFTETGACRYGLKCQFAHGKEEVRSVLRHPKYKTEICKTFHTTGTCPYGIRCRFIHTRSKEEVIAMVQRQQEEEEDVDDDELRLSAPPGINVPQWSKSWSMSMAPAVNNKNTHRVAVAVPEPAF